MSSATKRQFTPQEYLSLERKSPTRNEYFRGEIFAMAGTSREHSLIAVNLTRRIGNQLEDRPCEVYASDMRVLVDATGLYTYPDVVVVCGEPEFLDREVDTLLNPTVIFEVLSESTEAYDRGVKFGHYRRIPSLREYVLVSQDRMLVERYTRQGNDWLLSELTGGGSGPAAGFDRLRGSTRPDLCQGEVRARTDETACRSFTRR